MPQFVETPDGIQEFPDEATPEMISKALGLEKTPAPYTSSATAAINPPSGQEVSAAPPQDISWARYPRMALQQSEVGLGRLAGLPGDVISLANRGINALLPAEMRGPPLLQLPTSMGVADWLAHRGIGESLDVIPEGAGERGFAGAVQGLVGAAPLAALGPEAAAIPSLIGGGLGGATEGVTGSPTAGAVVGGLAGLGSAAMMMRHTIEGTAATLGSARSLQDAGQHIQNSAGEYFGPVSSERPASVFGPIPASSPTAIPGSWMTARPGALASKLLNSGKTDAGDLERLRSTLPESADELAASMLRSRPKAWRSLTPEAQQALIPDASQRRIVDMLTAPVQSHKLGSLIGGVGGGAAGTVLAHFIPETSAVHPMVSAAIGELLGLGAPYLGVGVRSLMHQPGMLLPGAIGGYVGENTLVPTMPPSALSP